MTISLVVCITSMKTQIPQAYEDIARKTASPFKLYDAKGIRLRRSFGGMVIFAEEASIKRQSIQY
ncbi:unnamed protein product [Haemonchus placei]|uniref:Uncharacterized protein n=1 Tax=Haemonchus placei TaxID=6290 RepID=A0A3P8BIB1_HAEPC|nr:unnamed protein product [Haemonchus placei]